MLDRQEAQQVAARLLEYHQGERESLDEIYAYWTGRQAAPIVPKGVPADVRRLAQMSRINVIAVVVSLMSQSLYVDGFREATVSGDDAPAWEIWQRNKLDAHQSGVHRAALAYGTGYVIVLPGDPVPVIRGVSPRSLVAMYDEDSGDWAHYALEVVQSPWDATEYRLYDDDAVYTLRRQERARAGSTELQLVSLDAHELGVCPVVRFRNVDTLNEPPLPARARYVPVAAVTGGEIEPLIALQDQIDVTTFDLLVAQRFQSFRQRYIMGWTADTEEEKARANASTLWTFENADTKVGEFGQVDLGGYLDSRQSTVTHLGVISQAPPHELLGKIANLSAEALAAAEVGQRRKVLERQNLFGESWEQTFWLASRAGGIDVSESAQVRWRDTEARSLSQTIDALGKLAQMLDVPPEMLWERIPGVTQQDVERWAAERAASQLLAAAATTPDQGTPAPAPELVPSAG
jgi:Phage portal protein, SPP1 Gp6-like